MKVILTQDVKDLGHKGDVLEVADGYARNFLIPQNMAVPYTKATENELAQKQQAITRRKEEKAKAAADIRTRIEAMEMELAVAAGNTGKLFGSVTSTQIVDWLSTQGLDVERKRVELPEGGIKVLGPHTVRLRLYGGEEAELKVVVKASGEDVVDEAPRKADEAAPEAGAADEIAEEDAADSMDAAVEDESADEAADETDSGIETEADED